MRDFRIDIMRFIGLLMIILAHINPPGFIFQLRNFDVPLMVLLSGMSFALTYQSESYSKYIFKRFRRLVFPVWIFLTFYFALNYLLGWPVQLPESSVVRDTYLLVGGIGYVWIIRVFLLVAMMAPLIFWLSDKEGSDAKFLTKVLVVYLVYEFSYYQVSSFLETGLWVFLKETVYYLIPYSVVFALGLRLQGFTRTKLYFLTFFFATVFVILSAWHLIHEGKFTSTQLFKYPPTAYYLSYALLVAVLIWLCSDKLSAFIEHLKIKGLVEFVSSNSIWIYLWHIPFVSLFKTHFLLKYLLVLGAAILIASLQVLLVKQTVVQIKSPSSRKLILNIFTG